MLVWEGVALAFAWPRRGRGRGKGEEVIGSASKLCTPVGEKEHGNEVSTTMTRTSSSLLYCRRGGVWWLMRNWPYKISAPARSSPRRRSRACCRAVVPLFCRLKKQGHFLPTPPHTQTHTQGLGHACITLLVRSPVSLAASSQDPSSTDFLTQPHPPTDLRSTAQDPLRDVSVPLPAARVPPPPPLPTPSVFPFSFLHLASS